tara:strand:- start:2750 stop:3139 length:390 start_codon:yes stop_codon:yes gene_type:complete
MIYNIYQIQLTDAQIDAVNNDETVPAYSAKMKLMMDFDGSNASEIAADALAQGYYSHVANITANDLEHVFEISNIGPESAIERLGRKSSLSVGDIIVDGNGIVWVCGSVGFDEIGTVPPVAQYDLLMSA